MASASLDIKRMSSPFPKRLNLLNPGVRFTACLCSSSMASCARFYPDSLMEPERTSCSMKFLAMQRRERDRDGDDKLVTRRRLLMESSATGRDAVDGSSPARECHRSGRC